MNKSSCKKTTLADSIEEQLRKAIITGEIQQGERINIKELTVKYGVSETPLRTALNRLVSENLIDNYPRQGMVVKQINIETARETFELRRMMELYYADKMTHAYAIDLSLRRALEDNVKSHYEATVNFPKDNSFDNYLFSRVMMGNVYNENSAVCLDDGRVLLGGNYGLTIINPSRISHVKGQTSVVFTSHPYSDEMTLSYEERSPKINFSTLDYSDVNNVKYTYWLEGYDSSWSIPSPTPWVNYQNLPFGSYRLHVKASYSDGIWGKESVLDICVQPPFYLSVWAWVFYALFLTVAIVMIAKSIREKNILKGKIKFEQELTRYKLVFFTNIAHEFRTPLTLIQGSLEKEKRIMKANHWQPELEKTMRTMDKSVQRMLRLIDQLLEFRKMQAGKLKLSLQETDVVMFVQGICKMFDDAAESKQIDFKLESQLPAYLMYLDQQKMDKVVFNLLSNAFKYTPVKGRIVVSLAFQEEKLIIRVKSPSMTTKGEEQSLW